MVIRTRAILRIHRRRHLSRLAETRNFLPRDEGGILEHRTWLEGGDAFMRRRAMGKAPVGSWPSSVELERDVVTLRLFVILVCDTQSSS